jgi:hypothetical protein
VHTREEKELFHSLERKSFDANTATVDYLGMAHAWNTQVFLMRDVEMQPTGNIFYKTEAALKGYGLGQAQRYQINMRMERPAGGGATVHAPATSSRAEAPPQLGQGMPFTPSQQGGPPHVYEGVPVWPVHVSLPGVVQNGLLVQQPIPPGPSERRSTTQPKVHKPHKCKTCRLPMFGHTFKKCAEAVQGKQAAQETLPP